jgi:hypothetical protein
MSFKETVSDLFERLELHRFFYGSHEYRGPKKNERHYLGSVIEFNRNCIQNVFSA